MVERNDTPEKEASEKIDGSEGNLDDKVVSKPVHTAKVHASKKAQPAKDEEFNEAGDDQEGDDDDTQISGASLEDDDAAIERERVSAQNAYQPEQREPAERGRKPTNARDLILKELSHRVERDRVRLRPVLAGKIIFEITDKNERFLFDWSSEQLVVGEAHDGTADCVITTSEREFLRVANGDLNPQVSMLSGKIKVKGKAALAIYVFNLIAPRQFVH